MKRIKKVNYGRYTKVYETNGRYTKVYLEDGGQFTKVTEANGDTVLVPRIGASGAGDEGRNVSLSVMAAQLKMTPKLLRTWTWNKAQEAAGKNAIPFHKHGNRLWFIQSEIDDWMAQLGTYAPAPSTAAMLKKLRQAGKRKRV